LETGHDIIGIVKQYKGLANPSFKNRTVQKIERTCQSKFNLALRVLVSAVASIFKAVLNCNNAL